MTTDLARRQHKPHITFTTASPRLSVRCVPGDGAPTVTDGYGNIETITRPLRRGLTRWTGSNPMQLSIPIIIDGFRHGHVIEPAIADLETMAGAGGDAPLHVSISGPGKLIPHADEWDWYISAIAWGDAVSNSEGRRVRISATITATAIIEAKSEKSIAKRGGGGHKHPTTYRVKAHDTLKSIARKVLKDVSRWVEIKKLNGITDPRVVGKPGKKKGAIGTVLKMPKG